jgi:alpha-D-ribose 1-methylphosphonate 5-triphosphate synthase subunit PhnL
MPTLTIILGLCGSGKSHFAKMLTCKVQFDEGFLNCQADHEWLFRALNHGEDCSIIEICYCSVAYRRIFLKELSERVKKVSVSWLCFENDIKAANRNCRRRPDRNPKSHFRINRRLRKEYIYPEGAVMLKVWRE